MSPQHTSRQPIRVAHLIQYFAVGGLERMVERLAAASKRRGVDSVVIAYRGDGPVRAALEAAGVQTVLMSQGEGLHPALTWQLTSFLRRERIDILHTHHLGPFLYGAPAAVLARCRRVHTEHSHELYDRPRRRLVGAMMSPLADVVAVTPEISEFRRRFPGECRVIRNGVPLPDPDPQLRERGRALLGATDESFVVGCAARLSEEKDHSGLLDAFAELAVREPRAVLACAGDGPLAEPLRARSAAAGLEDRVRWLGTLDDMPTFYAALDVCVLNSTREGLPLSLLEAMAFGVPIVATDVGGVGELLEGDAGVLVPPSQPSVLAIELALLANDPTRAQTVGRRGETKVRAEYSVDRMADDYVALYRSLVRRRLPRVGMESAQCV